MGVKIVARNPGGGGGDSDMKGCKFRILVSLRVFWAKCHSHMKK